MDIGRIAHGGVYIYRGELDFMARTILDSPHMETGGNLLGYWTPNGDAVIMYVLGPGRRSVCRFTSFIQDADYLQLHADRLFEEYHLSHIGVWHSHHGLGLSYPSGGDVQSNLRIADRPINSDLIASGNADVIISLEPMEALRYLPYLSREGWIITSSAPFVNIPNYPEEKVLKAELQKLPRVIMLDVNELAKEHNLPKCDNVILLGAAAN